MLRSAMDAALAAEREGRWDDAIAAYERALSALSREGDASDAAEILRRIGTMHARRGEVDLAEEVYEASLDVAERNELHRLAGSALVCLAVICQLRGDLAEARAQYERARELAARLGDDRLEAIAVLNIATLLNIRGEIDAALASYATALARFEALGDEANAAATLNCMGMAHVDGGDWESAAGFFERASGIARRLEDSATIGTIEINRAELYARSGNFEEARESCDRAFEIFRRIQSDSGIAETHKLYGVLFRETAKPGLADAHFEQAAELARRCHDRLLEAEVLNEWAVVHLEEERNREALRCLNAAHHAFRELHARRELMDLDRRLDGLEANYLRVVAAWGESIESKDGYTAGHCERVANYACMLAESVGITGRDLTWMRMGGYLHDVGKIAVPAEVLNKPGKLTPEEWALMQAHTTEGDAIVAELDFPWDIRPIVRSHHERWDGSGYPDRLKGEEIPLTARILCVADVYDALTTSRSYRAALPQEEALAIMEGDAGRIFDPALFARFRELIHHREPARDGRFPELGQNGVIAA